MPARMRSMPPNQIVGPVVATARPPEPRHPTGISVSKMHGESKAKRLGRAWTY
jgi:hypothetical protein